MILKQPPHSPRPWLDYIILSLIFILIKLFPKIYIITFLIFSIPEYIYLILFLFYTFFPATTKYYVYWIEEQSYLCMNKFDIWIEYGKISAFERVYMIHLKKKPTGGQLCYIFFIFFFKIPLKFLKIIWDLLKTKDFKVLCWWKYNNVKNKKIEIFEKKVYLNGDNYILFLINLHKNFPMVPKTVIASLTYDLREFVLNYQKFKSIDKRTEALFSSKFYTSEKIKIPSYHFAYFSQSTAIHITSSIPKKLTSSQLIRPSIYESVKPNSSKSSTIITPNFSLIKKENEAKLVSTLDLCLLKSTVPHLFTLTEWEEDFVKRLSNDIRLIFIKHLGDSLLLDNIDFVGLAYSCLNGELLLMQKEEISSDIERFFF